MHVCDKLTRLSFTHGNSGGNVFYKKNYKKKLLGLCMSVCIYIYIINWIW